MNYKKNTTAYRKLDFTATLKNIAAAGFSTTSVYCPRLSISAQTEQVESFCRDHDIAVIWK